MVSKPESGNKQKDEDQAKGIKWELGKKMERRRKMKQEK